MIGWRGGREGGLTSPPEDLILAAPSSKCPSFLDIKATLYPASAKIFLKSTRKFSTTTEDDTNAEADPTPITSHQTPTIESKYRRDSPDPEPYPATTKIPLDTAAILSIHLQFDSVMIVSV